MATKNQKLSILALVLVFVLPVILAKMALDNEWFNKASTNRGELVMPNIEAASLFGETEAKWKIAYVVPAKCLQACANAIFSMQQVRTAIGRHNDRVQKVLLMTEQSDRNAIPTTNLDSSTVVLETNVNTVNKMFKPMLNDDIFIVDTLHNVVLKYPASGDKEQAIMDSRDMLADIRKLLKLSRIG